MSSSSRRDNNTDEDADAEESKSDNDVEESPSAVDFEYKDSSDSDDDDHTITFRRKGGRSLLWLCQEGQLQLARKRFDWLWQEQRKENGDTKGSFAAQLHKEVFQVGHDKNYPLHEILMGGTSDRNAYQLTRSILDYAVGCHEREAPDGNTQQNNQQRPTAAVTRQAATKMLAARPPSHQRTALHWAAWGNANLEILEALVRGYPEALLLRDKRNQNQRTPCEILKHYYYNPNRHDHTATPADTSKPDYLERCTNSWRQHRLRLAVHMSVNRYFSASSSPSSDAVSSSALPKPPTLTPFDPHDRKRTQIKPKPWFVLSVLGSLVQREMKPLAVHILGYVGGRVVARKASPTVPRKRQKKRAASSCTSANSAASGEKRSCVAAAKKRKER
jgi:hypothetical protein